MTSSPTSEAPRRGRRARLNHEQIVRAALDMAGTDGLDALSMRRLASALGVSAMTLYGYFASKSVLVRAMLDAVAEELELDVDDGIAWPERLRLMAGRIRTTLQRYPGLAPLFVQRPDPRGRTLEVIEDAVGALREDGIPGDVAIRAVYAVTGFAIGFVAQEVRRSGHEPLLDYRDLPGDRFPNLTELADHASRFASDDQFQFGVEALIDSARREAVAA